MEASGARAKSGRAAGGAARVARVVAEHGPALQRVARQYSLCADDAQDAFQRALEIFWKRLERVEPATELAWLKVVVKHEALAVRRARGEHVGGDEGTLELLAGGRDAAAIDDGLASAERVRRSAEVIRRLKPDEAAALLLKAQGHSYREIGAMKGWTYTKVNRAITEGRRRFMDAYAEIEAGAACERHAPTLRALAQGRVGIEELRELRPHLRHCARCKAALRELRIPARRRVGLSLPVPALLGRVVHALHRTTAADAPLQMQLLAGGGGRGTAVAAIVGLCLGGAGAGVYCRGATGAGTAERAPHVAANHPRPRPRPRRAPPRARAVTTRAPAELAWRRPAAAPTGAPTRRPRRSSKRTRPSARATRARTARASTSARAQPRRAAATAAAAQPEFGFERSGASGVRAGGTSRSATAASARRPAVASPGPTAQPPARAPAARPAAPEGESEFLP